MFKRIVFAAASLVLPCLCLAQAQGPKTIYGRVVDEKGEGIEYVYVGIPRDTIMTVSDRSGRFSLTVPDNWDKEIQFNHVSYETFSIGPKVYEGLTDSLKVTLISKELPEIVVLPGEWKEKTILGRGTRWAGCVFGMSNKWGGILNNEWGSKVRVNKKTRIDRAELEADLFDARRAVLSFVVYRVEKDSLTFTPVQYTPVYQEITEEEGWKNMVFQLPVPIVLDPGTYFLGVRFVEFEGEGSLDCKGYFKNAYWQDIGKTIPISLGLKVTGAEFKERN